MAFRERIALEHPPPMLAALASVVRLGTKGNRSKSSCSAKQSGLRSAMGEARHCANHIVTAALLSLV
jgi:hypothetical protein